MPYYTEKQIDQARSIDLLTYLQSFEPTELVHVRGNTYCTREHDSLKISNGKWMWWSRGFGGNSALDYLIKVKGMQFMDAMKILTKEGTDLHDTDAKISRKPDCDVKRKLLLPDKSETNFEVIRYLTSRGIDSDVIKACIDEGLLYESLPYHNCIFVGFDETGNAAYAFYRATTGERLMGEAAGSDKRYSFRIDRAGSTLHVWRAEPMLSLGGVYAPSTNNKQTKLPIALQNMTHNQTQINTIALHLDNDYAGRSATRSISEQLGNKYIVRDEPPAYGKDCNDYLQQLQRQKRKRQMER